MDTDHLLNLAAQGDASAATALLTRHRDRLRRMVQLRIDRRLASRLDPSDIVQDALIEAHKRLANYAQKREIPFYPWLRSLAWEKLIEMKRRHLIAQRRSVTREATGLDLSGDSQMILVDRLAAATAAPSEELIRQEINARIEHSIGNLPERDREVIILRHLEELSFVEIGAVLGLSQDAVHSRYRRAIQRLHRALHEEDDVA
jgi:RNA polymerase sigma-70 factor (ECF subfamily)